MEDNKITSVLGATAANKDAEGKTPPVIIQQLTIRPNNRNIVDIEKWRNALRAAEATVPRRVELYDLYEEVMLDAHLTSVIDKRIMAVTNVEWQFLDKEGKEVEAIKEWIDTPDFETIVSELLNAKIWGYTMLEFDFYENGSWGVFPIPRKHMRPHLGVVSFEQTANAGINVREGRYAETILEAGNVKDLGLLLKAAPLAIYKRGNWGDWAQFIEQFGQPLIDAIWDGYDESQRLMLVNALDNIGGGGKIVRPAGTQLQILPGGAKQPHRSFERHLQESLQRRNVYPHSWPNRNHQQQCQQRLCASRGAWSY
jgi:phage gp29-like protein